MNFPQKVGGGGESGHKCSVKTKLENSNSEKVYLATLMLLGDLR